MNKTELIDAMSADAGISKAAVNRALVSLIGILFPSPTGPPDQPVLTNQQFTLYL